MLNLLKTLEDWIEPFDPRRKVATLVEPNGTFGFQLITRFGRIEDITMARLTPDQNLPIHERVRQDTIFPIPRDLIGPGDLLDILMSGLDDYDDIRNAIAMRAAARQDRG